MPLILLVDDDPEMLDLLEEVLQSFYSILKAADGTAALDFLKREKIDLIICDLVMPDMNGIEVCRIIKSSKEYCRMPFVLMSVNIAMDSKVSGLEAGADIYIEKPFSGQYLLAQIASLLTNRAIVKDFFTVFSLCGSNNAAHSSMDTRFMIELESVIVKNMKDANLNVNKLVAITGMSRMTLYRKVTLLFAMTPAELITVSRLIKASKLLAEGQFRIYEIASMVGFSSHGSFGRNFIRQFKMTPTQYLKAAKNTRIIP